MLESRILGENMELLPALAFFIGASYLVYRLRKLDIEINKLKKKLGERNGKE